MESLYVCHFSNGHIKVGRSIEPMARIASHSDRVSCMGVELVEHFIVECVGPASPREALLISRCAEAAANRFQNEWFDGLDYEEACAWADSFARHVMPDPTTVERNTFGHRLMKARKAKGITQAGLGKGMRADGGDLGKGSVSHWEINDGSPNVFQLKAICERLGITADYLLGVEQSALAQA